MTPFHRFIAASRGRFPDALGTLGWSQSYCNSLVSSGRSRITSDAGPHPPLDRGCLLCYPDVLIPHHIPVDPPRVHLSILPSATCSTHPFTSTRQHLTHTTTASVHNLKRCLAVILARMAIQSTTRASKTSRLKNSWWQTFRFPRWFSITGQVAGIVCGA